MFLMPVISWILNHAISQVSISTQTPAEPSSFREEEEETLMSSRAEDFLKHYHFPPQGPPK